MRILQLVYNKYYNRLHPDKREHTICARKQQKKTTAVAQIISARRTHCDSIRTFTFDAITRQNRYSFDFENEHVIRLKSRRSKTYIYIYICLHYRTYRDGISFKSLGSIYSVNNRAVTLATYRDYHWLIKRHRGSKPR